MIEILRNSVIEWRDSELNIAAVERVLWLSSATDFIIVINIGDMNNWPTTRTSEELQMAFGNGTARKLTVDPYARFANAPDEYIEKHKEIRDKAWAVIASIVEDEPNIYDSHSRGILVRHVCDEFGVHKKVVYDYLRRYWIRGKTINSLLPEFRNCGGPGKARILLPSESKRGRPPMVSRVDPSLIGINATEDDRKRIRIAIKDFYLTREKPSMTQVYEQMKRHYYNRSVTIVDGKFVPIMLPDNEIISFAQFR